MSQIISLDGNIGAGKSTILNHIKEVYENHQTNVIFLPEPVSDWETIRDSVSQETALEAFYRDQEKYSFPFQMMAYISRLKLLNDAVEKYPNSIIVTERCLNTDRYVFAKMLYDNKKMKDIEYQIYLKWFDYFIDRFQKLQKTIYMKTSPEICLQRIQKRNRDGEDNISLEYLQSCHNYHEEMISALEKKNVLVIDSDIDIEQEVVYKDIWLRNIQTFISLPTSPFETLPQVDNPTTNLEL